MNSDSSNNNISTPAEAPAEAPIPPTENQTEENSVPKPSDNTEPSLGGARRKNGHKANCKCHICENMKKKSSRGDYEKEAHKKQMGPSKKPNGHDFDCKCPICNNMDGSASSSKKKRKPRKGGGAASSVPAPPAPPTTAANAGKTPPPSNPSTSATEARTASTVTAKAVNAMTGGGKTLIDDFSKAVIPVFKKTCNELSSAGVSSKEIKKTVKKFADKLTGVAKSIQSIAAKTVRRSKK